MIWSVTSSPSDVLNALATWLQEHEHTSYRLEYAGATPQEATISLFVVFNVPTPDDELAAFHERVFREGI